MLSDLDVPVSTFDFEALRQAEFRRLDDEGVAYLDYTGSALYAASQIRAHSDRLMKGVFGNPHSENQPSRNSGEAMERARAATLAFFDADPDVYEVCFTANTSAAVKLVAEGYPFSPDRGLLLAADNHNSVNGVRQFARAASAPVSVLPLDEELRLQNPEFDLTRAVALRGAGLLAFPHQSNFSGVRHDLSLVHHARALGCEVLIDAAASGAAGPLSLREHPADFVACSFYKLFGFPTGVGALIARSSALSKLRRPWFAGGTVDFVSVKHERHALTAGAVGFEDGTPNFLDLAALEGGFAFLKTIPREALRAHCHILVRRFLDGSASMRHANGRPLVRLYGPDGMESRGGTVAFNILRPDGVCLSYAEVEGRARDCGVAIRGGCFCNPGAAERAFGFDSIDVQNCFELLSGRFTVKAFHDCVGGQQTVGALRLSVGMATNASDVDRALSLIKEYSV